ncbi:MAG: MFS transporter [Thermoplasmata archaeon]|nr:MFS transporter [Thermoplasmata archaeon]
MAGNGGGPTQRRFSFTKLVAGVLLLNASSGVLFAVLPLFEVQEGGGPLFATLIVGAPLLAQILATFLWGSLSDRSGRRRELLTAGVLGQSVLFLAYPFLDPAGLLLVRIVQVFLGAAASLATTVATEDPSRSAGQGLGNLSLWGGIGGVLGVVAGLPFLGGAQFSSHSLAAFELFVLLTALSGASVLCLAFSGELARLASTVRLRDALRFQSGPWVLRLSLASAIVGVANYTVYTLFPLFVRGVLAPQGSALFGAVLNPTQQLALLSLGAGMGGVLVSPITGRWVEGERRRRRLFLAAPVVYALLWTGFALIHSYGAIFLIWSVPAAIFFQLPLTREIAGLTHPEERGRAVGLFVAAYTSGGLVGAFIAGLGVQAGIPFSTMFLGAAAIDVAGFVALLAVRLPRGGVSTLEGGRHLSAATPHHP